MPPADGPAAVTAHAPAFPPPPAGRIVLSWLIRLRWFAVAGQLIAIGVAAALLGLDYPMIPLAAVLAVTLLTNAGLALWLRLSRAPRSLPLPGWLTLAVLLLDVVLLTVLLYYTGGPDNPFAVLFVVHVAMATLVLGPGWAWAVVATAGVCYGLIAWRHRPLAPGAEGAEAVPAWAQVLGQWTALLLVVVVLAYFIGRVMLALRTREQELSSMRERAALSDRLASLTTLSAGAAHELGTPLGTIAVVAKEMERDARRLAETPGITGEALAGAGSLADDAALVRQQVDRCRQILEHMRGDVAGRSTDEPGRCRVDDVLGAVVGQLRAGAQSRLEIHRDDPLPDVAAPLRAVQQAVQFLVNNAFDASGPDERVRLEIRSAGGIVQFVVTDRGTGMDAETLRRATEPFYTTKEPGRGMGLGLFLVRLVADRNGGRLEIESEPGKGTVARLVLPAAS